MTKKQTSFIPSTGKFRYSHGGEFRKKRRGRGARPLATKSPLHLVFKCNQSHVTGGLRSPKVFPICNAVIKQYAKRFFIKLEQFSLQKDHIHLLIRTTRRSLFQNFFRVVAGQIAQRLHNAGLALVSAPVTHPVGIANNKCKPKTRRLWKWRPFTRVVIGYKAYKIVRNYIQLNELEAQGKRTYRETRLVGLSPEELQNLWL